MHLNRSLRFLQFWDEDATSCGWGRAVRGNASSWPGWGVRKITTWWKIREQKWSKMYPFPFFGFDWPSWRDPSCWITLNRSSHTKCVCAFAVRTMTGGRTLDCTAFLLLTLYVWCQDPVLHTKGQEVTSETDCSLAKKRSKQRWWNYYMCNTCAY